MKSNPSPVRFGLILRLILAAGILAACAPPAAPVVITVVVPATSIPVAVVVTATAPNPAGPTITQTAGSVPVTANTNTPLPADTNTPIPTNTTGPQCTILQNVNFRSGPGFVFDPPIDALLKGTVVTPIGYQAKGFPGGPWVQVIYPDSKKTGWVSAGTDFVTCNLDLAGLPKVTIPPTPTPNTPPTVAAPKVTNTQVNGQFEDIPFKLHFSDTILVRLEAPYGNGQKDGDNVENVIFSVTDDSGEVLNHQENNAPYCIFGGDATCAVWPRQNGQYAWSNNGPLVQNGASYHMAITAHSKDGKTGQWFIDFTVNLP